MAPLCFPIRGLGEAVVQMWDFNITQAIGLMVRTAPFILLRLAVYIGIALAYMLATALGAGIGYSFGSVGSAGGGGAFWGGAIGFGLVGAVMYWAREYLLYLVKAGHIAVLVELIDGRGLPAGRGQIDHGTAIVKERFAQASALFALDQLVKGVIRAVTGLASGLLSFLPGAKQLRDIMRAFLRIAVGFLDEVILAHAIRTGSSNGWESAQEALVLYGQNWKVMLRNAAWLTVITYILGFAMFLLLLGPATYLVYLMPGAWSIGGFVLALLLAWSVKVALFEPFAVACLMQVYFQTIEGQRPDPEWDARLDQMSGQFRKIKARALAEPSGKVEVAA